jgi:hypothetical protein
MSSAIVARTTIAEDHIALSQRDTTFTVGSSAGQLEDAV